MEMDTEDLSQMDDEPSSNLIDFKSDDYSCGYSLYSLGLSRELNLICSNLNPDQEEKFTGFLTKKLANVVLRVGEGNLCTLDFSIEESSDIPSICYYTELTKPKTLAFNDSTEIDSSEAATRQQFIVCFLTSSTVDLEFFRCELQEFLDKFLTILNSDVNMIDKVAVIKYLEKWSYVALEYTCRCVALLGLDVSVLFYLASTNGRLEIEGGTEEVQSDICRFLANCSIAEMMALSTSEVSDSLKANKSVTRLKLIPDRSHAIEGADNDEYCKEWARLILEGEQTNPLFLKRVMENFKLLTVQSLNTFKRLLMDAEADHYSLYR
ncbi:hypothetical protein CHUAL_011837 [Chamberlinius hualienensis]